MACNFHSFIKWEYWLQITRFNNKLCSSLFFTSSNMAEPAGKELRSQSGTRRVTRSQQASLQSSQEDLAAAGYSVSTKNEGCAAKAEKQESPTPEKSDASSQLPECAVCLQTCVHPVKLPCSHIFCYLCVKGVAFQSRRCAMCRQEIPADSLLHPQLLDRSQLEKESSLEDGYQWFYEGRNGKSTFIIAFDCCTQNLK